MRPLAERLEQEKAELGETWNRLYDVFVERLRAHGAASGALSAGDAMPPFALPNSLGEYVSSAALLSRGPLVLSFYRGAWCRFCRTELSALEEALPDFRRAGVTLVAVSGEVGGRAEATREDLGLDYEVLCDVDHGLALAFGLVVRVTEAVREAYLDFGLDLARVYGSAAWFIPVPATYVIAPDGTIRFAHVDVEF